GIWKQAIELEPENSRWAIQLAHFYARQKDRGDPSATCQQASALRALEDASERMIPERQIMLMPQLAAVAIEAGQLEKARLYAERLLASASHQELNMMPGRAVHYGKTILGKLALMAGDIEGAKTYLIQSVEIPEGLSGTLPPRPDATLARELRE